MSTIKSEENFCILPWVAMQISSDGAIKTCCEQIDSYTKDLSVNLIKVFNTQKYRAIRSEFKKNNVPASCQSCIQRSKFTSTFKTTKHPQWQHLSGSLLNQTSHDGQSPFSVKFLDLRFGNLCNFSCRTCESASSSKLSKIDAMLGKPSFGLIQNDKNPKLIENILEILPHIEEIYFAGGEPLIMEGHYIILDWLVKNRRNVKITYNTNLSTTSFKGKDIRSYWDKLDKVEVYPSIDSIGRRGEYIRQGFSWSLFERNLKTFKDYIHYTNTVFSIYNAFSVLELIDYITSVHRIPVGIYPLHMPSNMSAGVLPKKEREKVSNRINQYLLKNSNLYETTRKHLLLIKNYLANCYDTRLSAEFKKVNKILDREYNKDFTKTFPELADWYMSID